MVSTILSLNVGGPSAMVWEGKEIVSSMHKKPIEGPLLVSQTYIEGDSFANPALHGTVDSVLYAFGISSALEFIRRLGRETYEPGTVGENLTLADLDETQVSVGDVFQMGEVVAQATFPRIPCGKVNFRMQHPEGQKAMQLCGRSGVYFRILQTGKIHRHDSVQRISKSDHPIWISDMYKKYTGDKSWTPEEISLARKNAALPARILNSFS